VGVLLIYDDPNTNGNGDRIKVAMRRFAKNGNIFVNVLLNYSFLFLTRMLFTVRNTSV